ncbi:MAG: hypothetical protein M0010_06135 [Actinomycetota bacterium]|nr:hypothetical protein [Actinomycetota bacterium]
MPPHRTVDAELLGRARLPVGDPDRLTLAGARRIGDPARRREALQAVRRAQYLTRRAARPTVSAREALGHVPAGSSQPVGTFFAVPEGGGDAVLLVGVEVSRADLRRVGRYLHLVRDLREGRVTGRAFVRRVSGWRPITVIGPPEFAGRYYFVSDPATATALSARATVEGVEEWIDSGRSRPRPRRRSARRRS